MRKRKRIACVIMMTVGLSAMLLSCASQPDQNQTADLHVPDRDQFINGGVSEFMGRRCGTLDCHGNVARPLRLYGDKGLRLEFVKDKPRDTRPTTPEEHLANYRSVIGLEPEDLSRSAESGAAFVDFMLFKKPLSIEKGGVRHKGGPILRDSESDPGWVCLRSWVASQVDAAKCKEATF